MVFPLTSIHKFQLTKNENNILGLDRKKTNSDINQTHACSKLLKNTTCPHMLGKWCFQKLLHFHTPLLYMSSRQKV